MGVQMMILSTIFVNPMAGIEYMIADVKFFVGTRIFK